MRTTIDESGRVVIPKSLRQATGLVAGEVEVVVDGAGIRIEPVSELGVTKRRGRLVIDAETALDDDVVRSLRFADQR
ncbi:MAG TPA: AbrB/MazE/SpoVT family DNA-binding domain-containing protein [Thermoanaerobaculia bacterium]|nr:AbrB/MazE/SpoVT family DNA-binding domain-containing protein [Thermoanaerobaculia bacterium]